MGKGDLRSRQGKIASETYGKTDLKSRKLKAARKK